MKIIALQAENIKKLVAISITPTGNMVELTGKNGQGKTSVLDAIWWALEGSKTIQQTPIRKGEKAARVRIDLGDIIVTRKFKATEDGGYTSSIQVETKDGLKYSSPQGVLDKLMGDLTFNPLEFAKADPSKQFDTLKKFVPGVDFGAIFEANNADFDRRTMVNRAAKDARSAAASMNIPETVPAGRVDDSALLKQMETAADTNADIERRKAARESAAKDIERQRQQAIDIVALAQENVDKAVKALEDVKKTAAQIVTEYTKTQVRLDAAEPLPAPVDVSDIRAKIDEARRDNALLDAYERRQAKITEADGYESQAAALTKAMEEREADKMAKIAAAKLPIKGITFGEGIVLLNGVPFDQASDAEQLRASIAIAMALNPKLRVIRVRDGSLLDEDSMKLLADMAAENDYQVWVERVDGTGKVGFVLEDGHVREAVAA